MATNHIYFTPFKTEGETQFYSVHAYGHELDEIKELRNRDFSIGEIKVSKNSIQGVYIKPPEFVKPGTLKSHNKFPIFAIFGKGKEIDFNDLDNDVIFKIKNIFLGRLAEEYFNNK